MSQSSNNNSSVAYFNAHTEGLGYLDGLVHVTPKPGQDFEAFWSASFCMLEGNPQKPEKTYVSLTVPSDKALENLRPFLDDINGQATKVFVGLRLAKFRGKPFVFAPDSQSPGKLGVNYSARLIAVLYLKVGDTVIKLKRDEQEATTDFGIPASSATERNTQNTSVSTMQSDLPFVVQLSKAGISTDEFEVAKARLKESGYRWHAEKQVWALPLVKLDKSDATFHAKISELKKLGYRWSNSQVAWEISFSNPQNRSQGEYRSNNQRYSQERSHQQH